MNAREITRIAGAFDSRWQRHYVASKLRTDPVYQTIAGLLAESRWPVLDIGCGMGLLAFHLRASGISSPIVGVDFDEPKITAAAKVAGKLDTRDVRFLASDVHGGLPDHLGNVCLLDVLQYLDPAAQKELLTAAAARVAPGGGMLIIRSGLRDASLRYKITLAGDVFARAVRWLKSGPKHFPAAEDFQRILAPHGMVEITQLWGKTPFNNHLITLRPHPVGECC